jgi:hypothetical protein
LILAEDGGNPGVDVGQALGNGLQGLADQQAAFEGADGDHRHHAVGELEHLQGFGELDELADVVGDDLLGADRVIDGEVGVVEELGVVLVVGGAQAGDAGRDVEQGLGDPAGAQVGLVGLGDGDQQVGVGGAGAVEDGRRGGVAGDDPQVETLLQVGEAFAVVVDDGDVVGLRDEALGHRGADLAGAEDDDLHCSSPPGVGSQAGPVPGQPSPLSWRLPTLMPSCLSLR